MQLACVAGLVTASVSGQDLQINFGPKPGSVLQRNAEGRADVKIAGTAPRTAAGKYIESRVLNTEGAPLAGQDWKALERVNNNAWDGMLKGLPHGGPYTLEVRVAGTSTIAKSEDFYVGDLWILAGQSNMEGVGNLDGNVEKPDPRIRSFSQSDVWEEARDPLHLLAGATDRVHWRNKDKDGNPVRLTGAELDNYIANRKKGAGLGLSFAKRIVERTGVPIGLVPCAHGGTSMDQWSPELKGKLGDSLYGATLRRFLAVGGRVKGILWYQGESDANPKAVGEYAAKFEKLIASFREDFLQPELPFYYVQIGRHTNLTNVAEWNAVQEAQRKLEAKVQRAGMVPSVDLSLDDQIHVGTQDLKRLGRRLADLISHDLFPELEKYKPYRRGPRPAQAVKEGNNIKMLFAEVNGKLVTQGRLSGFSIHGPDGTLIPAIFRQEIDPANGNGVVLHIQGNLPEGAALYYGYGKDPYVNLNDQLDMGTPAFGPLPIQ
jgi:sialate O-acetylesterase